MSLQLEVDAQEEKNIRAYDLWSAWAQEHELEEIERKLQGESVKFRRRWVVVAVVVLIGLAALFLRIVLIAVHAA